jgi:hypothetical protein
MSVTNSLTSTLSIFSNLSEDNGQNRNDTDNYFDPTNVSKQMESFETSNGKHHDLFFIYFNISNKNRLVKSSTISITSVNY